MQSTFLGLSLTYWSIPCLVMGSIWLFIWPSYRAEGASLVRWLILRWAHALTWFLLAAATLLTGTGLGGSGWLGAILALLAVVAYGSFLYVTVTTNTTSAIPRNE